MDFGDRPTYEPVLEHEIVTALLLSCTMPTDCSRDPH
jgi:hypothetical protein